MTLQINTSSIHPTPMQRLTVVIPVHNAAPWLGQCLDSLFAQTRPIDEIIAVNDGSTDTSEEILVEYAARHPALKILRTPGGGASVARNAGIEVASGDWLAFVDADDWIEPDTYERLLALGETENLDMVLTNGRYFYEGCPPNHRIYSDAPLCGTRRGGDWLAHKLENRSLLHMVWLHVYRRSFVERHHLRFVSGITYEDVIWTTRALVHAERVDYLDVPFFVYRKLPRRLDATANDRKMLHIIASSKTNAAMLEQIAREAAEPRWARLIRWQLVDGGLAIFHRANQIVDPQLRRAAWRALWADGTLALLWRNRSNFTQTKKLAHRALRVLAAQFGKARTAP